MDINTALETELKTIFQNNVYPVSAPKDVTNKYCTYEATGNEREQHLTDYSGLISPQYQIFYYHSSFASLIGLKAQLIALIKSFNLRNLAGDGPYIQQCEITNDFETHESNVKLYKGVIEITLHFDE